MVDEHNGQRKGTGDRQADATASHLPSDPGMEGKRTARSHAEKENWFIGHSRSVGLIGAIEFCYENNKKFDLSKKIAAQANKIIQSKGVILRALPGDIIGFCPPLIISEEQINEMFDIIVLFYTFFSVRIWME